MAEFKVQSLKIVFRHGNHHEIVGSLVGLELASYEYRRATQNLWNRMIPARIEIKGARPNQLAEAARNGTAINISRHLVNAPAGDLNPETYELAVRTLFSDIKGVKISSIVGDKLLKENMNLIHAVGVGANTEPRMIRISYRPKSTKRPIALVGKGVTFDTGGLNMKPSAGMRLMKKDMGGSAAVCGASWNLAGSGSSQPFDAYLALAENSVDRHAYHPGDILTARNGKTVEIHNTDAEGRLVMADVLDYAITATGKDQPSLVVNVATLTGAIKVALGSELAGLFSNNDKLSDALVASSVTCGDRLWRMPLVQEYRAMIASPMADMLNSATTGFGGAITAGLFLESFVGSCPWAHIDIYAWTDRPQGALREVGASGQGVQLLSHWLGALK